ncbi:MAG: hypothetical protein LBS83_01600 [Holosporales bacterium]|jgi:hypothetical protein|nr:hypothetical protein [Holosporales bacterium]
MENFRFLDFKNPNHFFDISVNSVKTTEGINTQIATFTITGTGNKIAHTQQSLWVLATIMPQDSATKDVFLQYNNGEQSFAPIPVFPIIPRPVSNLSIIFKDFLSTQNIGEVSEKILFEKDFSQIEDSAFLSIVSEDIKHPVYIEPISGKAMPLWCVGGYYQDCCDLEEIESLFIFPVQKKNAQEIIINTYSFSEIVKKDPQFAYGNTERFAMVQRDSPWNLVSEIEKGKAILRVEEKIFKSAMIEKTSQISGEVLIKFVKI